MCLIISRDQVQNEKDLNRWFGNRKKFAYVYKRLRKHNYESFYRSPIYEFVWDFKKKKVYQVNRDPKPTVEELYRGDIHKGLHVYTSLEAISHINHGLPIVKFRVLKKDIVAVQNDCYWENNNLEEAVCTKLEFVKVIED